MSTDGSIACPRTVTVSSTAAAVTLADVLQRLEADDSLEPRRVAEMRSAIKTVCRVFGAHPSLVPAEPRQLRPKLAKLTPAMAGVSPGRWCNIKSLMLKALKRAGLKSMAGRSREPLAPEWEALRALLPDRHFQSGLSRFLSFCTAGGIEPAAVTVDAFTRFGREVTEFSLVRDPGGLYRDTCKLWNLAARTIPGWPRLEVPVPDRRRDFALDLEELPKSFQGEVGTFLARGANPDVFSDDYCKPAADLTVRNRRRQILMAATALVRSGVPIARITGLEVLVELDHAKAALRQLYDRAGGKTTSQTHQIATLLKVIARRHLHQPEHAVGQLRHLAKALKPSSQGFTEKNRECLRQFADLKKLMTLLTLPERVITQAARSRQLRRRDAVRVELGMAIAILLNIPLRAANLAGLRVDRHLQFVGGRGFIQIPAEETKNDNPIEVELPARLVHQLRTYFDRHRPLLVSTPSPWLFPGESGARRPSGGFGQQLSAFIAKEVGVMMTPHQFRHLAAKLYLDQHPDGFETVRRLLGHKSLETTMRFYRELDSILASKRYAAVLDELQARLPPRRRRTKAA